MHFGSIRSQADRKSPCQRRRRTTASKAAAQPSIEGRGSGRRGIEMPGPIPRCGSADVREYGSAEREHRSRSRYDGGDSTRAYGEAGIFTHRIVAAASAAAVGRHRGHIGRSDRRHLHGHVGSVNGRQPECQGHQKPQHQGDQLSGCETLHCRNRMVPGLTCGKGFVRLRPCAAVSEPPQIQARTMTWGRLRTIDCCPKKSVASPARLSRTSVDMARGGPI